MLLQLFLKASSEDLENWACKRLYSPFIIEQVNTLSSLEPDERTQKALILVYLNHLINFSRFLPVFSRSSGPRSFS
jgi:hypothetical protein